MAKKPSLSETQAKRTAAAKVCGSIGGLGIDVAMILKMIESIEGRCIRILAHDEVAGELTTKQKLEVKRLDGDVTGIRDKVNDWRRRCDMLDLEVNRQSKESQKST